MTRPEFLSLHFRERSRAVVREDESRRGLLVDEFAACLKPESLVEYLLVGKKAPPTGARSAFGRSKKSAPPVTETPATQNYAPCFPAGSPKRGRSRRVRARAWELGP